MNGLFYFQFLFMFFIVYSKTIIKTKIPKIFINAKYSMWYNWNNPRNCPYKCDLTNDIRRSDAVIWNIVNPGTYSPSKIEKNSIWILNTYFEPPRNDNLKGLEGRIDYIQSYRHDSDFIESRINYKPGKTPRAFNNKTRQVTWMVSNCSGKRMSVYKKLKKGLQIDAFGRCFKDKDTGCGKAGPQGRLQDQKCIDNLLGKYKFYLAFENSECLDYVSEKITNAFRYNAIPIVFGGLHGRSEFEKVAPPGSFIHVNDFKTIDGLIDYVNYLDRNDTAYNEYFEWTKHYSIQGNGYVSAAYNLNKVEMCKLCGVINGKINLVSRGVNFNLKNWWKVDTCR